MSPKDERTLIAAAQAGDSEAMGQLLDAQKGWIITRLALHGVRNDDDGMQNAYVRCMAGILAYDLGMPQHVRLTTWLALRIRQAAHDTHKSRHLIKIGEHQRCQEYWQKANAARFPASLDAPITDRGMTLHHKLMGHDATLDNAQRDEDAAKLKAAMLTIHPRYRAILEMRVFEELNLQEIGDRLGLTRERIRQIVVKAMDLLRKRLIA